MSDKNTTDIVKEFVEKNFTNAEINANNVVKVYTDTKSEYNALRRGVGIRNISRNAIIQLEGESTLPFLNRISTNLVTDLPEGSATKTLFTNSRGGVIGRTSLANLGENIFLLLGSFNNNVRLSHWIRNFMTDEKIKISDLTEKHLLLEFYGPQANSYLTILCGKEIEELEEGNIKLFKSENFEFYLIRTLDAVGIEKYWLKLINEESDEFLQHLLDSKSVFDVQMIGYDAFNSFRIEEGIPLVPNEFTGKHNPREANLMAEVNLDKGVFIGYDSVVRKSEFLEPRKIAGVILDEVIEFDAPLKLYDVNGKKNGIITSKTDSFLLSKKIGLGYFPESSLNTEEPIAFFTKEGEKIKLKPMELPFQK